MIGYLQTNLFLMHEIYYIKIELISPFFSSDLLFRKRSLLIPPAKQDEFNTLLTTFFYEIVLKKLPKPRIGIKKGNQSKAIKNK